jgi:hypothetical protein
LATGVNCSGLRVRSISVTPSQSSSTRMRRENAGCETWRRSEAAEKLPVSSKAM